MTQPELHPRLVLVTPELVAFGATGGVGFTNLQMKALGERPIKGWRARATGKVVTYAAAHTFLFGARRRKYRPRPGSPEEQAALALLERCGVQLSDSSGIHVIRDQVRRPEVWRVAPVKLDTQSETAEKAPNATGRAP